MQQIFYTILWRKCFFRHVNRSGREKNLLFYLFSLKLRVKVNCIFEFDLIGFVNER